MNFYWDKGNLQDLPAWLNIHSVSPIVFFEFILEANLRRLREILRWCAELLCQLEPTCSSIISSNTKKYNYLFCSNWAWNSFVGESHIQASELYVIWSHLQHFSLAETSITIGCPCLNFAMATWLVFHENFCYDVVDVSFLQNWSPFEQKISIFI